MPIIVPPLRLINTDGSVTTVTSLSIGPGLIAVNGTISISALNLSTTLPAGQNQPWIDGQLLAFS